MKQKDGGFPPNPSMLKLTRSVFTVRAAALARLEEPAPQRSARSLFILCISNTRQLVHALPALERAVFLGLIFQIAFYSAI